MGLDLRDISRVTLSALCIFATERISTSDAISVQHETIAGDLSLSRIEYVSTRESLESRLASIGVVLSDTTSVSDTPVVKVGLLTTSKTDTSTLSETGTVRLSKLIIPSSESPVSVSDSKNVKLEQLVVSVSDAIGITDTQESKLGRLLVNPTDKVVVSDSGTIRIGTLAIQAVDKLTVSDLKTITIGAASSLNYTIGDSGIVSDTATVQIPAFHIDPLTVNVYDSTSISDTSTIVKDILSQSQDFNTVSDYSTVRINSLLIGAIDTITTNDILNTKLDSLLIKNIESINVSEGSTVYTASIVPLYISATEYISVYEDQVGNNVVLPLDRALKFEVDSFVNIYNANKYTNLFIAEERIDYDS